MSAPGEAKARRARRFASARGRQLDATIVENVSETAA